MMLIKSHTIIDLNGASSTNKSKLKVSCQIILASYIESHDLHYLLAGTHTEALPVSLLFTGGVFRVHY